MRRAATLRSALTFACALAASGAAHGETLPEPDDEAEPVSLEAYPPDVIERLQAIDLFLLLEKLAREKDEVTLSNSGATTKSIIDRALMPDTSSGPIKVCFIGASNTLRRKVVKAATAWEVQGSSLRFDFGDRSYPRSCSEGGRSRIRISFNGAGTWSLIGKKGDLFKEQDKPTMNFHSRIDWEQKPEKEFKRIVQHEFGHAIGLYHEHQNPNADCLNELDWELAAPALRRSPYNLTDELIRLNFEMNFTGDADIAASAPDPHSVMHYDLPAGWFRRKEQSPCYHPPGSAISNGDELAVREHFPTNARLAAQQRSDAYHSYVATLQTLDISQQEKDAALIMAGSFFPFKDGKLEQAYLDAAEQLLTQ